MDSTTFAAWATVGAALVTAWMAKETRGVAVQTQREADQVATQAELMQRQIEVATRALQSDALPWLRPEPGVSVDVDGSPDDGLSYLVVQMKVVNVGRGIAVIPPRGLELRPHRPDTDADVRWGTGRVGVIEPGAMESISFRTRLLPGLGPFASYDRVIGRRDGVFGDLRIDVNYTDHVGGQQSRMSVQLADAEGVGEWVIGKISYFSGDGQVPTVESQV